MEGSFNQQILVDELAKLYNSQRQIDGLSSWCINYKQNAKEVVEIWLRQLLSCPREQIVASVHLANEILRKCGKNGIEFINEFWKVLPKALSFALGKGDECAKAVLKLLCIWEEHEFFGSKSKELREKIAIIISETIKMDGKAELEDARKMNEKTKLETKTPQFHHLLEATIISGHMKTGTGISSEMEAKPTFSSSSAKLQYLLSSLVSAGVIGLAESPVPKKKLKTSEPLPQPPMQLVPYLQSSRMELPPLPPLPFPSTKPIALPTQTLSIQTSAGSSKCVPSRYNSAPSPLPQPPMQLVPHLQSSRMELPPLPPLPFPSTKPIALPTQTLSIQTSAGTSKGVPSRYNSAPSRLSNYPAMGKHSDPNFLNSNYSFLVMERRNLSVRPALQMVPPLSGQEQRTRYRKALVAKYGRMPK